MENSLEVQNLCKSYREGLRGKLIPALQNVSFSVPKGVIYGFLGANGAGKTTSIKILLGLQYPSSGSAFLLGEPCGEESARRKVGYLPERPYFHDNLTADEFLNFHRQLHGHLPHARKMSNGELLRLVGIPDTKSKLLRGFSKGMLQRVGIAQALINDPDLVILDEPMSGLDPIGRKDIRNLILQLSQQGKTVFFSTHILADVESVCNRIAFLEKGVLRYEGELKKILEGNANEFEIIFSGVDADAISRHSLLSSAKPFGSAWKIAASGNEQSRGIIESIWQVRGALNSVSRQHKTLEEALFGVAEGERP